MRSVVIVGASLAGLRAAEALRAAGYDGSLRIVGAENHPPYDRPPLSKQVLTGKVDPAGTALPLPEDLGADLILGRAATGLDPVGRRLLVGDESVDFDGLVIATGAAPRVLPAVPPGAGVHYLRTLDDSAALREDLLGGGPLVVIGAGFIGLEVACSAMSLGVDVVVLEALPVPLERAVGPEMGRALLDWHRSKGLDVRTGVAVEGIDVAAGRPSAVRLADGTSVPAGTVVVGVGVAPAVDWLTGAGVDIGDGVLCDSRLSVLAGGMPLDGVVAVGDCARWDHPSYGSTRVEHWTHATESADAAARTLLEGAGTAEYAPVPYFWSDQHGVKIQFVGRWSAGDEMAVVEGSLEEDRVLVAYGREGRLTAALGIRRPARVMALQREIAAGGAFPPPPA